MKKECNNYTSPILDGFVSQWLEKRAASEAHAQQLTASPYLGEYESLGNGGYRRLPAPSAE